MSNKRAAVMQMEQRIFLETYAATANFTAAGKAAGVTRYAHYNWIKRDPDYAERFAQAEAEAIDALEAEARRRATEGVEKPVFYKGEIVGHIREHSDVLLMFLLNGALPDKYKRRYDVEQRVVTVDAIDAEIQRLEATLEPGAGAPADRGAAPEA